MYAVLKDQIVQVVKPLDPGHEPVVLPEDSVFTISMLENMAWRDNPKVSTDGFRRGISLSVVDENNNPLVAYDLAVEHSESTLQNLRDLIYARESEGEKTLLVFTVNEGQPNVFRTAIVATPIWNGTSMKEGRMTWRICSLLAECEEIAIFCRLLNKHELVAF